MKLNKNFVLYESGNEKMLIDASGSFSGIVKCNETAVQVVKALQNEITMEEIVDLMLKEYCVARDVIEADVKDLINKLASVGAVINEQ